LKTPDGTPVHLSEFAKKGYTVLIFYPGDETAGAQTTLCRTRRLGEIRKQAGARFRHQSGRHRVSPEVHGASWIPVPLLADPGSKTAKAYGCAGGLFIKRTVFVIDPNGVIVYSKRGMPSNEEILQAIPLPAKTQ